MRRLVPWSRCASVAGGACLALALVAAGPPQKGTKPPPKVSTKKQTYKVDETVGDVADIRSSGTIHVEGVGLVDGLDGNGSDPEPGYFREKLVTRMKKDGVYKADELFATKNYSLVLISANIPIGVGPTDPFDVELQVPPSSTTKSLAGGTLFLAELREVRVEKGQALDGNVLAHAFGPVMGGENPRVGRIPGGARVKAAVPYTLVIKEKRKSISTSRTVETVINERFHQRGKAAEDGMSKAKTDEFLVLHVPHVYHNNQPRYFQVLSNLCIVNNKPELIADRMKKWSAELLDPKTAGVAALRLEGVGRNASDALKKGLESPNAQVRFFSAEALAYLNESAGADVLAKAAADDPAFRVYALRALAAMDHPAASLRLRNLMALRDPEVRYGAFDALRALDPRSPHLGQVAVLSQAPEPEADDDEDQASMAIQLKKSARRRQDRPKDPFNLYLVDSEGPPSIHVRTKGRCEVVVFGRGQNLQTPIVLGGEGPILLNASLDDAKVQISRMATGRPDQPDMKVDSSLAIGEVIRKMADLGASYPSIVAVLDGASRQGNLPGPFIIDAAPAARKDYVAAQIDGVDTTVKGDKPKKDDAVGRAGFESGKRHGLFNMFRRGADDK